MGENQKNDDSSSLLKVFLDLGALSEAMLAHLGAMLGRLGAILEQLGDKMWLESAKMSQDSGQERQGKMAKMGGQREKLGASGREQRTRLLARVGKVPVASRLSDHLETTPNKQNT